MEKITRDVAMVPVESTNIAAIAYDEAARTLLVQFHGERTYLYHDVPAQVYHDLVDAPSKGRYHHRAIKWEYRCERVATEGSYVPA